MSRMDDLIRRQTQAWGRMQELHTRAVNENRPMTAEETTNWEAANDELNAVDREVEQQRIMDERQSVDRSQVISTSGGPADPEGGSRTPEQVATEYREAWGAYMRRGLNNVTQRQRELLEANHTDLEGRAQGGGTPEAGGFLVPPEFRRTLVEVLASYGGMYQYCNVITTDTGADLPWPVSDDTMNEGVEIAENTQVPEQDVAFKTRRIGAHIYTSKMVRVPWSLINDSAFDLEDFLARKFGERLGRIYARRILTGSGDGQPLGLVAPSRIGVTDGLKIGATTAAGSTPTLDFDSFIDLEHAIDPAYRNRGNARFGVSDGALKMARKIKDADQRYMWQPAVAADQSATLNGYPYFVDNTMAGPEANGVAAVFGDFRAGYLIRVVQGFQSVKLGERYADLMQTGFFAYSRMDGRPDDPKALAAMRFGATA